MVWTTGAEALQGVGSAVHTLYHHPLLDTASNLPASRSIYGCAREYNPPHASPYQKWHRPGNTGGVVP